MFDLCKRNCPVCIVIFALIPIMNGCLGSWVDMLQGGSQQHPSYTACKNMLVSVYNVISSSIFKICKAFLSQMLLKVSFGNGNREFQITVYGER